MSDTFTHTRMIMFARNVAQWPGTMLMHITVMEMEYRVFEKVTFC